MESLFVACPAYGNVHLQTCAALTSLAAHLTAHRTPNCLVLRHDADIVRCRSDLLSAFVHDKAWSHLLFVDSDLSFTPTAIENMGARDKDVIAAAYRKKEAPKPQLADFGTSPYLGKYAVKLTMPLSTEGSLAKADGLATGLLLLSRYACEHAYNTHPQYEYVNHQGGKSRCVFHPIIDEQTQQYLGEDYSFSRRLMNIGFTLWCDLSIDTVHWGEYAFHGSPCQLFRSLEK